MPLYEYRCEAGHVTEQLRRYGARNRAAVCEECGQEARRIPSAHHQAVDGIYSYAPNVGTLSRHEELNDRVPEDSR